MHHKLLLAVVVIMINVLVSEITHIKLMIMTLFDFSGSWCMELNVKGQLSKGPMNPKDVQIMTVNKICHNRP